MLEGRLSGIDGLKAPKTGNSKVDVILEVLHLARERERLRTSIPTN